jgi:hypothetical protein
MASCPSNVECKNAALPLQPPCINANSLHLACFARRRTIVEQQATGTAEKAGNNQQEQQVWSARTRMPCSSAAIALACSMASSMDIPPYITKRKRKECGVSIGDGHERERPEGTRTVVEP